MGFLASAAAQIKQLPANTVLEIAGYTDNVGDPSANLTLSQQRADAVRSELVRNGVAASMLVAKGYGEAKPIASNDSAEGRFRNRRIEYHVLQP
jgi:outer membrane protein OmpA-like peptidoglycan-associated protein